MEINDGERLIKAMEFAVKDFNNRPHVSLQGLTPIEAEAHVQVDKNKRKSQIQTATLERKAHNKLNQCAHCR